MMVLIHPALMKIVDNSSAADNEDMILEQLETFPRLGDKKFLCI